MEVSSQSDQNESDSFFAVNKLVESSEGNISLAEENAPIKQYNPFFLILLVDFIDPLCLLLCALSTLASLGLLFTFLIILHVIFSYQKNKSFRPLTTIISFEILFSLILFVISILTNDDNVYSIPVKIIGLSFAEVSFARVASLLAVFAQSITIHFSHYFATTQNYNEVHEQFHLNPYSLFINECVHVLSISLLSSTNISYLWFPIVAYFLYTNLCFIFTGHEISWIPFKDIILVYSILYGMFELYMCSFLGDYSDPSGPIGFSYIGYTQSAKNMTLFFSIILVWTSSIMLMTMKSQKENPIPNDLFSLDAYKIVLLVVICSLFFFTILFPNFLTNLDLIIVFFLFFSDFSIISACYFPFLGGIFVVTFLILSVTQYTTFKAPEDNGSEQMLTFAKLFGLFRYQGGKTAFSFCFSGFIISWALGQTGKVKFSCQKEKQKVNNKPDNMSKVQLYLMKAYYIFKKIVCFICKFIYKLLIYLSAPVCIIDALYAGFWTDEWLFQILSLIVTIFLLLFLYTKWSFTIIKIVSGLILLFCIASFDYNTENGCFIFGLDHGICPPPDKDILSYSWPVIVVFILSTFITREPKCINLTFSPLTIALLYILIGICDFIYVFAFDICVFSIFYFFIGCLIIAFQCLKWNHWRTIMIMLSFISISIQLALYQLARHDDMRNFFISHVNPKIIDIDVKSHDVLEIILLSFMIYLNSIVFRGVQTIEPGEIAFQILQLIHEISYELYFYFAWIFIFALSIANSSPSFLKFFFLILFSFGSLSSRFFFDFRVWILLIFSAYVLAQFVFNVFISLSEDATNICTHIGLYYTNGEYSNSAKNNALGWEFAFMLISMLNVQPFKKLIPSEHFEKFELTKIFKCFLAFLHFMLPVMIKVVLFACASFNTTFFSWILYGLIVTATYSPNFFNRSIPIVLFIIHIYFLAQYLLYLGLPSSLITIRSPIDRIAETRRSLAIDWFEFLGIMHVSNSSLITTWLSCISLTFYYQFNRIQVDYLHRFKIMHSFIQSVCNIIVTNCFLIFFSLILIFASISHKPDGVILLIFGLFYFGANLLFAFQKRPAVLIVQAYIYIVFLFRILSKLPIFVNTEKTEPLISLFDFPMDGTSESTIIWIFIYAFCQILMHFLVSENYKNLREQRLKRYAFRFIRDRQIHIIEKLDQDILLCKRKQEIDTLNNDRKIQIGKEVFEISNSTIQLVQANGKVNSRLNNELNEQIDNSLENDSNYSDLSLSTSNTAFSTLNCSEISEPLKQDKWYLRFFHSIIEPQIIRLTKVLCTSLPINLEAGVNVLTLESLILLMKRCLSHYEKKEEYHLEEREKQFLISLPPSFAFHFSSIYHLTDYQPFADHNSMQIFTRYFCFFLRQLQVPFLLLITTIYVFIKPYLFALIISFFVIFLFCSLDIRGFSNIYRTFYVIVSMAYILQSLAITDLISDRLKTIQGADARQNPISSLALIGLDPYSNATIEIFLFIATLFLLSDHLSNFHIFQPNIYYEYITKSLPNFPNEYCYGIMDDPVHNLGMRISQTPPFFATIKKAMNRVWLRTTEHHNFLLILNLVSLIILLLYWSTWESTTDIYGETQRFSFNVSSLFIWVLIIDIIWQLAIYFYCMNERYVILLILEGIFFVYMYCLMFFYIRSHSNNQILSSAQFFIFLRIVQHIIVAHICFCGRSNISYRYPDFTKQWKVILVKNTFIRYFPFAFEVQIIFMWIGKRTWLSLPELLIVREMEIQLELDICEKIKEQEKKKKGVKPGPTCRKCIGFCLLFLIVFLCFLPLTFLLNLSEGQVHNELKIASITINFASLPPLYQAIGSIKVLNNKELNEIGFDSNSMPRSYDSKFGITFPAFSNVPFELSHFAFEKLTQSLSQDNLDQFYFFIEYTFYFARPTTNAKQTVLRYRSKGSPLTKDEIDHLLIVLNEIRANNFTYSTNLLENNLTVISPKLQMNRVFSVLVDDNLSPVSGITSPFVLSWNGDSYQLFFSNISDVHLVQNNRQFQIAIFSSDVFLDFELQAFYLQNRDVGFITFYILIVLLFIAIKGAILKKLDYLWITRIDNPMKYYRMVIAINMFKNAKDVKAEKEMCRIFINKLKGRGNDLDEDKKKLE